MFGLVIYLFFISYLIIICYILQIINKKIYTIVLS